MFPLPLVTPVKRRPLPLAPFLQFPERLATPPLKLLPLPALPLALAAASPSLVRSEIRSRSTSANNPNRAIITLVGRSCLPSNSMASLMAMKRILRRTRVSTIWIT